MVRAAWLIAANDLRRRIRDRSIIIQGLIAPVVIAFVVGAAFGKGPTVDITIGVANRDDSVLSQQIASSLVGAGGGDGVSFSEISDPDGVGAAVDSDAYDAAIVLPAGLGTAVVGGRATGIEVVGSAGSQLAQSVAESIAQGLAADLQTVRVTAAAAVDAGVPEDVGRLIQQARKAPPAVQVSQGGVSGTFSVMAYFAPGIAMLFLFFIVGNGARSIIAERREGTLDRILAAPVRPGSVLLGKTIGVMLVGVLSLVTVWLVTAVGFGVYWGNPVGVLLVILAVVLAIAGISLLITGLARTENQADAITTIVALLFAVAGGTFFYGGGGMMWLRQLTPNGQALAAFVDLSAGRAPVIDVLPRVLLLAVIGVVCGLVGLAALSKKVRS